MKKIMTLLLLTFMGTNFYPMNKKFEQKLSNKEIKKLKEEIDQLSKETEKDFFEWLEKKQNAKKNAKIDVKELYQRLEDWVKENGYFLKNDYLLEEYQPNTN